MLLSAIDRIVEEEWLKTPKVRPRVELDEYVIMPNHIHGIIILKDKTGGATRRVVPAMGTRGSTGRDVRPYRGKPEPGFSLSPQHRINLCSFVRDRLALCSKPFLKDLRSARIVGACIRGPMPGALRQHRDFDSAVRCPRCCHFHHHHTSWIAAGRRLILLSENQSAYSNRNDLAISSTVFRSSFQTSAFRSSSVTCSRAYFLYAAFVV